MSDLTKKMQEIAESLDKNQRLADIAAAEFGELLRSMGIQDGFKLPLLVKMVYEKGFEDGKNDKPSIIV